MTKKLKNIVVIFVVILICVCVSCFFVYKSYTKTPEKILTKNQKKQLFKNIDSEDTIFVSIPSYRDRQCVETIIDIFNKAICPERIFIGVCQQNAPGDIDVYKAYNEAVKHGRVSDFSTQIRIKNIHAKNATGPLYARHIIETLLYKQERFYLMIDSHMIFVPNWDVLMIRDLKRAEQISPKAILTTYPKQCRMIDRYNPHNTLVNIPPTYLCFEKFNEHHGLPQLKARECKNNPVQTFKSLFWSSCFSFTRGLSHQEVPYDPFCPYLFLGEAFVMSCRFFTHGYNFFAPTQTLLLHVYDRSYRPTFWEQINSEKRLQMEQKSYDRIRFLLGIPLEKIENKDNHMIKERLHTIYKLGRKRSLSSYFQFCGVNPVTQESNDIVSNMGTLYPCNNSDEILSKFGSLTGYYTNIDQVQEKKE